MKLLITFLIIFSSLIASDIKKGQVGGEKYTVTFPVKADEGHTDKNHTIVARDGNKAMYILSTSKTSITRPLPQTIQILMGVYNIPPKKILSHNGKKEGNYAILDMDTLNEKTLVRTKIRYIITSQNVWQLKTVFDNPEEQNHDEFIQSFKIE